MSVAGSTIRIGVAEKPIIKRNKLYRGAIQLVPSHSQRFVAEGNGEVQQEEILELLASTSSHLRFETSKGMTVDPTGLVRGLSARFSSYGFSRLCSTLGVPERFIAHYSDLEPEQTATIINRLLEDHSDTQFVVTGDNKIEGVVSSRYSRLSNHDIAHNVFALRPQVGSVRFVHVSGVRMRLATGSDNVFYPSDADKSDALTTGIEVYNGEDGGVSFDVSGFVWRLVCTNGMVGLRRESLGRLAHRGASLPERASNLIHKAFSGATRYAPFIRDSVRMDWNVLDQRAFATEVEDRFSKAFAVNVIAEASSSAKQMKREIPSVYHAWNGITEVAKDTESLDRMRAAQVFAGEFLTKTVEAKRKEAVS